MFYTPYQCYVTATTTIEELLQAAERRTLPGMNGLELGDSYEKGVSLLGAPQSGQVHLGLDGNFRGRSALYSDSEGSLKAFWTNASNQIWWLKVIYKNPDIFYEFQGQPSKRAKYISFDNYYLLLHPPDEYGGVNVNLMRYSQR